MKTVRSQKLTTKLGNVFVLVCLLALSSSSVISVQAQVSFANATPQISDGDLDPTFGTNGTVTTDFNNSIDYGWSIALQPDGKIIMAGASINNNGTDFVVARYNKDGSLDTTFDTDGKVVTDFGSNDDGGYDVAIQPDGKIVVAGSIFTDHGDNFALARYNTDGSLDTTFDSDGKVITAIGNFADRGYGVAIQSDGKIVMAGFALGDNFALARYNSNGSLDMNFGTDGKVITNLGRGNATVIQPIDGKIIVAGDSNGSFALARYNNDGSLDTTFDNDGKVTTTIAGGDFATDIALQPDGKIVAAGFGDNISTYRDFVLMRYNSNGTLDTTFDTDGKVATDFGSEDDGRAIVIQPDGKIVMVGAGNVLSTFALARYNNDGTLDNNFGTGGKVITQIGSSSVAYAVALQPDGNIIVAGSSYNGSDLDFALARYMGNSPPTVVSINRASSNPTSASSANLTVTFSEPVTGVGTSAPFDDFALTTSGVLGAAITNVSGSGATYTVTVNTGVNTSPNNGTIRLDIPAAASITDMVGNPLASLPYKSGATYTISKLPTVATLTYPVGPITTDYNPIYTWNKVATATKYHLYISGPKGKLLDQWFEASSICDDTTCSVDPGPTLTLGVGNYSWWVQTYNAAGNGPWSVETKFSTAAPIGPAVPTLTYPVPTPPDTSLDIGANYTPTFTWNRVDTATYYHIYIKGPGNVKLLDKWYKSVDVCPADTCAVVSPTLKAGEHSWWLQSYSPAGTSDWTAETKFSTSTALSGKVTQTEPTGDITTYEPTYKWSKDPAAIHYRLLVKGPGNVTVLDKWYQETSVLCDVPVTDECSVVSPTLKVGAHTWSVQTYSSAGYMWSDGMSFNTPTTAVAVPTLTYPVPTPPETVEDIGANYTPTFTWNKVNTATHYHIYVQGPGKVKLLDKWYKSVDVCPADTCSVLSPTLKAGEHSWWSQAYSPAGTSAWSAETKFSTSTNLPGKVTQTEPNGDITTYEPTYIWTKDPAATHYRLLVKGPGNVTVLDKWFSESVVCDVPVANECSTTGPTLKVGAHTWWVQTYSPAGYTWSDGMSFNTPTTAIAVPVLTFPVPTPPETVEDIGMNYNPMYTWEKVELATYYHLYLSGPKGKVLDQWYLASSICDATTCSIPSTSSPTLLGGAHSWWVQAYSPKGTSAWTAETKFNTDIQTVPPAATLVGPKGLTSEHTQTYAWTKVPIATWYHVYVKGPSGVVLDKWYQSVTACIGDACSVTGPRLESGDFIWWVQAYNSAGYGPWKSASFKISP